MKVDRILIFVMLIFVFLIHIGCAVKMTELRRISRNPINERFKLNSPNGPKVSDRTKLILRMYNLETSRSYSLQTLVRLRNEIKKAPNAELVASFVELAYFEAKRQELTHYELASELYVAAAVHAYWYLFAPQFTDSRNNYDRRFQDICLLYNASVEGLLRLFCEGQKDLRLQPGTNICFKMDEEEWKIRCDLVTGNWAENEIESFRFASDYEILGLENEYRQGGLGVPLIAQRKNIRTEKKEEKYYPQDLCFPVTAFLRPVFKSPHQSYILNPQNLFNAANNGYSTEFNIKGKVGDSKNQGNDDPDSFQNLDAVLELYDPLVSTYTQVGNAVVPLESDLTTPLACFFTNPSAVSLNTVGLLRPDELLKPIPGLSDRSMRTFKGLYMMQPYEPQKIPVVMIHGLWSSPMTWIEMFNTLRSIKEIRENYQFWFYFYPSGQPFWVSAAQLRDDLQEICQTLDPNNQEEALDEMVLIGHSMGGLISRLQVMDSDNHIWQLISDAPFNKVELEEEQKTELQKWFFFQANPSIRRVITIATPFEGSKVVNNLTQWFAQRVISIPQQVNNVLLNVLSLHSHLIQDDSLLTINTSIDSLSPNCSFYQGMNKCSIPSNVVCNNIVGVLPELENRWIKPKKSDGVVDFWSSHREDVESEIEIPTNHMYVHTHPAAIRETHRILQEHLYQMRLEKQWKEARKEMSNRNIRKF
ncbi:MAG: alpha/beta hydrolase [Planctomycetia bacterium]|nr:alpha/beta hydrolase [Planctomycetia bacterium]